MKEFFKSEVSSRVSSKAESANILMFNKMLKLRELRRPQKRKNTTVGADPCPCVVSFLWSSEFAQFLHFAKEAPTRPPTSP